MCGIAGILLNNSNKKLIEKFQKISNQLLHRGPDSSSFYKNSKNLFIHTRLSIIDLKGLLGESEFHRQFSIIMGFDQRIDRPIDCCAMLNEDRKHAISWLGFEDAKY